MQYMKIREFLRITLVPLNIDSSIEVEHILIMEVHGDVPMQYYLAELPAIDNDIRCRLRFYENLVN